MSEKIYHAGLPYPVVTGLRPNPKLALLLCEGYCGAKSEFTTAAQYAYHHLRCLRNQELAETLKGIHLVEIYHLELLGRCIVQLGVDPTYLIDRFEKPELWRSDLVEYESNMRSMLMADIKGEQGAVEYYIKTAEEIGNSKIAALLIRISKDEELHYKMFSELYQKYYS